MRSVAIKSDDINLLLIPNHFNYSLVRKKMHQFS